MTLLLLFCFGITVIIPYCVAESWTVSVYTGKERYAGTDSNVYIRLFDPQGVNTRESQLTHRNWIPENNGILIRNLFEMGARDRFLIRTEDVKSVSKIMIRRDNSLLFQANWLLDQVIVERNDNGAKYVFKCDCWLRREHPYITLSATPDPRLDDKSKSNNSTSSFKRTFIVILLLFISIATGLLCCYNQYRRRQRYSVSSRIDTSEPPPPESSLRGTCHPEASRSASTAEYWMNTLRQWKTLPQRLSSDRHARTAQSTAAAAQTTSLAMPFEEPPSYDDLYPNQTAPVNNVPNFNS